MTIYESNQHKVEERLIDFFPIEKMLSFNMRVDSNSKILFTKNMIDWSAWDDTNKKWSVVHTGDLRKTIAADAIDIILNKGTGVDILNSLSADDLTLYWKTEDYDPNMFSIAYANIDEASFQVINKIKINAVWKMLKEQHEQREVYVKIYNNHNKSILKNPMTSYKITNLTPSIGSPIDIYTDFNIDTAMRRTFLNDTATNKNIIISKIPPHLNKLDTSFKEEFQYLIMDEIDSYFAYTDLINISYKKYTVNEPFDIPRLIEDVYITDINNLKTYNGYILEYSINSRSIEDVYRTDINNLKTYNGYILEYSINSRSIEDVYITDINNLKTYNGYILEYSINSRSIEDVYRTDINNLKTYNGYIIVI